MQKLAKVVLLFSFMLMSLISCKWDGPKNVIICGPPTNLVADEVGPTYINISWTPPSGVDSFQITISPPAVGGANTFITSESKYSITGLQPETDYTIQVRSICNGELSVPATANFRTSSIIIIDLITQIEPTQQQIIDSICDGGVADMNTMTWNDQNKYEVMHLIAKNSANEVISSVCILKYFDSGADQNHFYVLSKDKIMCGSETLFELLATPTSKSTSNLLSRSDSALNYTINVTNSTAQMTFIQPSNIPVTGTIYR